MKIEALQYYWSCCCCRIPQALKTCLGCCLSWKGENLACAGGSLLFVGWRKVVSKSPQQCCCQSCTSPVICKALQVLSESLWLNAHSCCWFFSISAFLFPPCFRGIPGRWEVTGNQGFGFFFFSWSWLSFCCVVRALFPNSWIRVLGVFQTLWSP